MIRPVIDHERMSSPDIDRAVTRAVSAKDWADTSFLQSLLGTGSQAGLRVRGDDAQRGEEGLGVHQHRHGPRDAPVIRGQATMAGAQYRGTEVPDVRMSVLVRPKGSTPGTARVAKLLEVLYDTPSLSDCGCTMRLVHRDALVVL